VEWFRWLAGISPTEPVLSGRGQRVRGETADGRPMETHRSSAWRTCGCVSGLAADESRGLSILAVQQRQGTIQRAFAWRLPTRDSTFVAFAVNRRRRSHGGALPCGMSTPQGAWTARPRPSRRDGLTSAELTATADDVLRSTRPSYRRLPGTNGKGRGRCEGPATAIAEPAGGRAVHRGSGRGVGRRRNRDRLAGQQQPGAVGGRPARLRARGGGRRR
jgi:hypothetical protein